MTKVWGFGAPVGPLQFSSTGWRENALAALEPGDVVVLVGTLGAETQPHEQGRILGMMEPTDKRVAALDFLKPDRPEDFGPDGEYKWPFALLNRRAWTFDEPRVRLADVSSRTFSMDSAQGIVPLTDDEAATILKLPRTEVALRTSFKTEQRLEGSEVVRRRGAPPPSTMRRGVMHMRRAPAYTYAFKLAGARPSGFKIGWAFDWSARMAGFNQAAMPSLGGLEYKQLIVELWPTAMDAFRMEQAILKAYNGRRHPRNREIITGLGDGDFLAKWAEVLAGQIKARRQA
ncbi:hypothetical protein [Caulobacter sp.]|uniref:hypothetical protein n=1 Tax=Caulobacter sp. TaxID=78 RepID=UPI001B247A18|nr:hypothetical protein [Caulobacter sp.]MBO9545654.1 GIY-YIG nuclease family protein [Caulobacter sp.]